MKSILKFLSVLSLFFMITTVAYFMLEDLKYKIVIPSEDLFNVEIKKQKFEDVITFANNNGLTLTIIDDSEQIRIHTNNMSFFEEKLNRNQIKLIPGIFYENKKYKMKDIVHYPVDSKSFFVNGTSEKTRDLFNHLKEMGIKVRWQKVFSYQSPLLYLFIFITALTWMITLSLNFIQLISLKQKKSALFKQFGYSNLQICRYFLSYSINVTTIVVVFIYCILLWIIAKSFFVNISFISFLLLFLLSLCVYIITVLLSILMFILLSSDISTGIKGRGRLIFTIVLCFLFTMLNYTGIFMVNNRISEQFQLIKDKNQIEQIAHYLDLKFTDTPRDPRREKEFFQNNQRLFSELNQYGFLVSNSYIEEQSKCKDGPLDPYCNTVIVNENYLKEILGLKNVNIDEGFLLLIPKMYEDKEKEIVNLYQDMLMLIGNPSNNSVINTAIIDNDIHIPHFNIKAQSGNMFTIKNNPMILLLTENNLDEYNYTHFLTSGSFKIDSRKIKKAELIEYINGFVNMHDSTGKITVSSSQQEFLDYYSLNKNLVYFIVLLQVIIFIIGYLGIISSIKILIELKRDKYVLNLIHGKAFNQVFSKEIFITSTAFAISQIIIYLGATIFNLSFYFYFPISLMIFILSTLFMFTSFEKISKEVFH